MRIVAGSLGGRVFESPHGNRTRPMSEKARGALFNALGDIDGLVALDAFAGSGALSLEAISRGASSVLAIDKSLEAYRAIEKNVKSFSLGDRIDYRRMNVRTWSDQNPGQQFDIVFADPPYDDLRLDIVEKLAVHVDVGGLLVLSWPGSDTLPLINELSLVANKSLGDIQLGFYRRQA